MGSKKMLQSFHTHSGQPDSSLRKVSLAKVIEKVSSSVLWPEGKRRRRAGVTMFHVRRCYIIIDIFLIDETCGSICSFPPPSKQYVQKLRKLHNFLRGKNFPRTQTSPRDISRARGESRKNVSIDRERRTKKGRQQRTQKSGRDTMRMRANSAATEGRKIDGWAESKNFPLQSALGFPLVGTSHESRRDIYSVDSRVSKFPPANTATSNNSGLPRTDDALFFST